MFEKNYASYPYNNLISLGAQHASEVELRSYDVIGDVIIFLLSEQEQAAPLELQSQELHQSAGRATQSAGGPG